MQFNTEIGSKVEIEMPQGPAPATVVDKPFFDPKKQLAAA
jgi:aminomethyltransferase